MYGDTNPSKVGFRLSKGKLVYDPDLAKRQETINPMAGVPNETSKHEGNRRVDTEVAQHEHWDSNREHILTCGCRLRWDRGQKVWYYPTTCKFGCESDR